MRAASVLELTRHLRCTEHLSPYCRHCKHSSAWEKLIVEVESSADPGIHFAQVDCVPGGGA
jgi:hypothetical protein